MAWPRDGTDFKRTWVIKDRMPIGGYVTAIGFYGDHVRPGELGHGSKGGWDKFGPERLVTKSKGNILYERWTVALHCNCTKNISVTAPPVCLATGTALPLAIRSFEHGRESPGSAPSWPCRRSRTIHDIRG